MKVLVKTLGTIVLAVAVGMAFRTNEFALNYFFPYVSLGGSLFLNALMMAVLPLVMTSVILGISKIGNGEDAKRLAKKVFSSFLFNSSLSVLTGWLVFSLMSPLLFKSGHMYISVSTETREIAAFTDIFMKLFPRNIFKAMTDGEMIGIIVFCMMFGLSLGRVAKDETVFVNKALQGVFDTTLGMTRMIMQALPLGIFCLVLDASVRINLSTFQSIGFFFVMIVLGIILHMGLWLFILSSTLKVSPKKFLEINQTALVTAFSTSSSAATLPVTLDCLENKMGVSQRVTRFMIPLGTTINMAGTALFVCAAALFLAKAYGLEMTLTHQASIVFISLLTSYGIAGIPSACLVALMIVLSSIGIPSEAVALIIGIDRILDMIRTLCNVYCNIACSLMVAHYEGEAIKI